MSSDDGDASLAALELEGLSSRRAIASVALPAILLNAAAPLTASVQTALLGNLAPTSALAAFGAVSICVGLVARVFNFLVDGVSSKVGRSAGQRNWPSLSTHVQLSMRWSALLGVAAVPLLLASRRPLCGGALGLASEVQEAAWPYWVLRSWLTPLQLLNMAAAGILQGFSRVRVNAALTSTAALLEMAGSTAVLRWQAAAQLDDGGQPSAAAAARSLLAMGCVTFACQAMLTLASLACIIALPPPKAQGRVHLARDVFGLSWLCPGGSSDESGGGTTAEGEDLAQPLLNGPAEDGAAAGSLDSPASAPGQHLSSSLPPTPAVQEQLAAVSQPLPVGSPSRRPGGGRLLDEATQEFLRDGLDMFVRSMVLQLTFFMAMAAAARLGTAALAAHSIVGQLWVIVSYAVDGFAAAGIVLGSRIFGYARTPAWRSEAKRHMGRLTGRVLFAGAVSGLAAGLAYFAARDRLIALFSSDPEVAAVLRGAAWLVLAAAQPLNGLLFVFDGLMYATQQFRFVRNNMASGFLFLFCPLLAAQVFAFPCLAGIWAAKAALNVWRLGGAAFLIYWRFLPSFGEEEEGKRRAGGGGGAVDRSREQQDRLPPAGMDEA